MSLDIFSYKLGEKSGGGLSDTEELTVALSMADDDQIIVPSVGGKVMSKVTVTKPETLVPQNVRSGIDVGGVVGSFLGDTEEKTVALNFANGTQTVEPSAAGKVLSKVNIPMPDTLLPENIAEGIDIAGIIGTLAGGGGANVKITCGQLAGTGSGATIEHGLGVVPDFVTVYTGSRLSVNHLHFACGLSTAFANKMWQNGMYSIWRNLVCGRNTSNTVFYSLYNNGTENIDNESTSSRIGNANAVSFTVGSDTVPLRTGDTYYWIAIAGLT